MGSTASRLSRIQLVMIPFQASGVDVDAAVARVGAPSLVDELWLLVSGDATGPWHVTPGFEYAVA